MHNCVAEVILEQPFKYTKADVTEMREIIACYTDNILNQISPSNSKDFQNSLKKFTFEKVLLTAPDIPQVTAQGNKGRVTGQEMCSHMYLPSPGVSFHSCE